MVIKYFCTGGIWWPTAKLKCILVTWNGLGPDAYKLDRIPNIYKSNRIDSSYMNWPTCDTSWVGLTRKNCGFDCLTRFFKKRIDLQLRLLIQPNTFLSDSICLPPLHIGGEIFLSAQYQGPLKNYNILAKLSKYMLVILHF